VLTSHHKIQAYSQDLFLLYTPYKALPPHEGPPSGYFFFSIS
jgi:hypothetical protein